MDTTIISRFTGKTVFIAGGSGTWGNELTKQLLDLGVEQIRIFSRGEIAQVNMRRKFLSQRIKCIIGDVRDYDAVYSAMQGADYVFNLAALKHVGICEEQPQEALKTNVDGTRNMIKAATELKISKFIFASTDKAIYPSNLYGMTKGLCERLIIQANAIAENTDFICVRSGNIMGSSGSVIPLFIQMAKEKNVINITDNRMTRFFLPVKHVAKLMISAASFGIGGEIFVPKMPSFYIKDLAELMLEYHGDSDTMKLNEVGARAGEKLHELLVSPHESDYTREFPDFFVIFPSIPVNRIHATESGREVTFEQLSSSDVLATKNYLKDVLLDNGFLQ